MKISRSKSNFFDGIIYNVPDKLMAIGLFHGLWTVLITNKTKRGEGKTQIFSDEEDVKDFIHEYFKKDLDIEFED